ncbi:hypothetical protein HG535_0E00720 [Zygotorulaspora mrakii]|uniref:Uncharacterized protein n=1 Tax=Zygotorulaspora mrakii TaxID=42260 RepID=A0A7H9B2V5_ZYGMR|nr:uncharacterized protein HG535_0E00720 [Zygotorulaspora mrakii]QLG72988.1 hypothetical protein HG535_0E00720 [Zygotorulaspora mrakii]
MPHRRIIPGNKIPLSQSSKRNVESCPNSFLATSDCKEKEFLRHKRNRKLESSPILEICKEEAPVLQSMVNPPKSHSAANTPDNFLQMKENQQASSAGVKRYAQGNPNDSAVQQYTLMTYSSGQMVNSLYPNYNVSVPFFSHYSNYSIHNLPGINGNALNFNKLDNSNHVLEGQSFPTFFNPRTATNMPHKEKVNSWIENIPVYEIEEGLWESECYDMEYSLNWEEDEFENPEFYRTSTISYAMNDEVLFLQAKKFETLVRKLYESEREARQFDKDFPLDATSITDYI